MTELTVVSHLLPFDQRDSHHKANDGDMEKHKTFTYWIASAVSVINVHIIMMSLR